MLEAIIYPSEFTFIHLRSHIPVPFHIDWIMYDVQCSELDAQDLECVRRRDPKIDYLPN